MTQQDDITQRVLTDAALNDLENQVQRDIPRFGPNVHIGVRAGLLRKMLSKLRAPVADERDRNATISQIVGLCNRIPGATTWNAAQFMYDEMHRRAALASAPVAGEAKNYPGENVAERLDNMADDQPPGSQAQSDLYAAATIWRKHIAHRAAPQASVEAFDFVAHLARQAEFSARTFGPGARVAGVCDHIRKELIEVETSGGDLKEWVDVIILGLDGAWRSGATPQEIIAAIVAKQAKNEARTWPDWRTVDPNKAIEHQRTASRCTCPSGDGSLRHPCPMHPGVDKDGGQQHAGVVTDDMRYAVRFAPSSAHWSERLVEFFGPDAREGIDALERQLREARAMLDRQQRAGDAVRDALWTLTEHNALHFGEQHSTVIQGRAALSAPQAEQGERE